MDEVPTIRKTSQSRARCAPASAAAGIASPNQTTPGRRYPPHQGQGGGSRGKGTVSSCQDEGRHFSEQATSQREPWNRVTFAVPARSCRPSTFCVTSANDSKRRLHSARTSCARLGRQRATS